MISKRNFPFITWLPKVTKRDLRADLSAGLTGGIVVLPQGVAFATIAGMPPEYGLYAGMIPAIIAALMGSSRHLVSGPTTAASIVLFSSLSIHAIPGTSEFVSLALTLTFMVGIIQLVLGLARMGALVNFISHSVVVGFTSGAALLIAAKQLKHAFGITMPSGGHLHDIIWFFSTHLDEVNLYVTSVAVVTLLSGVLLRKFVPRAPYLIICMIIGSVLAALLNLIFGADHTGIETVGALPASLPPLSAPTFDPEMIRAIAPTALAVTLFALTEAVSIGRSLAAKGGYRIDGNQEFIGQGLSNIFGSFFSSYVSTGSFNRSGLNYEAGARTPLAAVFAGLILMVIVLLVAPLVAYLPKAAMAGVLFIVAWGLIDRHEIRHIFTSSKRESSVLFVTLGSALFLDLEFAIFAGVLLSLLLFLEREAKPLIKRCTPDPRTYKRNFVTDTSLQECPQLRFITIEGPLFFGSVNRVMDSFDLFRNKNPEQKHLAVMAEGISNVDLQGGETLASEFKARRDMGGQMYLIQVRQQLWDALQACDCMDEHSDRNIFESKQAAVHGIYQQLDKETCVNCDKRIFFECRKEFGPGNHNKQS